MRASWSGACQRLCAGLIWLMRSPFPGPPLRGQQPRELPRGLLLQSEHCIADLFGSRPAHRHQRIIEVLALDIGCRERAIACALVHLLVMFERAAAAHADLDAAGEVLREPRARVGLALAFGGQLEDPGVGPRFVVKLGESEAALDQESRDDKLRAELR